MSWKAEVITDNSGQWRGNELRFATQAEAEDYLSNLAWLWSAVRDTRAVECEDDAINAGYEYETLYQYDPGRVWPTKATEAQHRRLTNDAS